MKSKKKPQIMKIFINSDKIPNLKFDKDSQILTISNLKKFDNPKLNQIKTEIIYERASGKDKVLHSQYFDRNSFDFNFDDGLKNRYNMVFACDTNTKTIGQKKLSIGCLCILGFSETEYSLIPIRAIAFSSEESDDVNPERVTWEYFLKYINNDKYKESKICLFVDSELNKLNEINLGQNAVFKNYFLPKNITLNYASSDTGKEYIGNRLLSCADNASKELLNFLIENSFEFPNFKNSIIMFVKNIKTRSHEFVTVPVNN
ncbi:hypothetical protein [Flavobacterium johnsoniae]|uniref:hypothetical protein n=1 Tax=Flavobacterium johnsoniae TaxID=986 RepID=UPI003D985C7A